MRNGFREAIGIHMTGIHMTGTEHREQWRNEWQTGDWRIILKKIKMFWNEVSELGRVSKQGTRW